jgi:hypothetical protein
MLTLRVAAIFANLLFIIYGSGLGLKPVLALHCVLLPINVMRLITVMPERPERCCQTNQKSLEKSPTPAWIRPRRVDATR